MCPNRDNSGDTRMDELIQSPSLIPASQNLVNISKPYMPTKLHITGFVPGPVLYLPRGN